MSRPFRLCVLCVCAFPSFIRAEPLLQVGFAESDITPKLDAKAVFIAGFGQNRKATRINDPLMARVVVLSDGDRKIAIASIDVVGLFFQSVENIRKQLPGFHYVAVTSTHNHNGPDTLGLWGPNPFTSGVDPEYLKLIETRVVEAVRAAEKSLRPAVAVIGSVTAPDMLHDGRDPQVKHDELVVVQFRDPKSAQPVGTIVQWNCHPETVDSKGTAITADYVGATVHWLREHYHCPAVYLTGTVGGLMTTIRVKVIDTNGTVLPEGSFEKMKRYGELLGELAKLAIDQGKPIGLTPIVGRGRSIALPVDNTVYQLGKRLGVLNRPMETWTGDLYQKRSEPRSEIQGRMAVRTEVGYIRLGELEIAVIPGEIYPELVLDKVPDPAEPGADFPDAAIEPAIYKQLRARHRMVIGLGNDELGYILPKREWDEKPPFMYGRKTAPYGEINSLGPETGPLICRAFRELVEGAGNK